MIQCPNCGRQSFTGASECGCTWAEQLEARRRKEVERRRREMEKGRRPVVVDFQSSYSGHNTQDQRPATADETTPHGRIASPLHPLVMP